MDEMRTLRAILRSCRPLVTLDRAALLTHCRAWLRSLPRPNLPE